MIASTTLRRCLPVAQVGWWFTITLTNPAIRRRARASGYDGKARQSCKSVQADRTCSRGPPPTVDDAVTVQNPPVHPTRKTARHPGPTRSYHFVALCLQGRMPTPGNCQETAGTPSSVRRNARRVPLEDHHPMPSPTCWVAAVDAPTTPNTIEARLLGPSPGKMLGTRSSLQIAAADERTRKPPSCLFARLVLSQEENHRVPAFVGGAPVSSETVSGGRVRLDAAELAETVTR